MAHSNPQKRPLGAKGPDVVSMGLGLMGLSAIYGPKRPDAERFALLDRAHALGATFWDSSDIYGDSEDLLGKWFARTGKRDDIFLATKFAVATTPDGQRTIRNEPAYVHEACTKSLARLGVPTIDLYYCHRFSGTVPVEDVVGAMAELVHEGKVKYLGLSEVSAATLRRACKVHPIAAVQMEYSPFSLDVERPDIELLQACRELGVALVAYSPLGRGFLTGRYRSLDDFDESDFRRSMPRFSPANFPKNLELVHKIKAIADRKDCTPGQLVLAWLLKQGDDIFLIPGTSRIENLEENMAALRVELDDGEAQEIRKAAEEAEVLGERYPPASMAAVFADTPEKQ